ncbi:RNA methyltransferase [Fibrobacterales bacterium]|nr:RNA methyltransferase [Fibrobacterales bacterium]
MENLERRIKKHIKAPLHFFKAGAHIGFESTLARELSLLGIAGAETENGAVHFNSKLETVWNAQAVSRCARNFEMQIAKFPCENFGKLEHEIKNIAWELYLPQNCEVKVKVFCKKSRLYHQGAVEERVKAIVENALSLIAPPLNSQLITIRIENDICSVWQDLSGEPLYKRNGRFVEDAPLQETLAASILLYSDFVKFDKLIDPMAGSGVFSLEAAQYLWGKPSERNFAVMNTPAFREQAYNHFLKNYNKLVIPVQTGHQADRRLRYVIPVQTGILGTQTEDLSSYFECKQIQNAQAEIPACTEMTHIITSDIDPKAVQTIKRNAEVAGLENYIKPEVKDFFSLQPEKNALLILNPPYGKRMEKDKKLYLEIGKKISSDFKDSSAVVLVPQNETIGKNFKKVLETFNGGIKITIYSRH